MSWLFWIPVIFWWIVITTLTIGTFVCVAYSRYSVICRKKIPHDKDKTLCSNSEATLTKQSLRQKLNSYCYGLCRYYSILIGKIPSNRMRKFLLKSIFGMRIAKKAVVYGGFEIRSPWNIQLGECVIGVNALLDGRNGIVINDGVCLAQNVSIYTEQHDINDPMFGTNGKGGQVYIDELAWISSRTTILPKVQVGQGAVLAAGAVATKNLEPYGVYAGIPAKKISERNREIKYSVVNAYWHFY